METDYSIVRTLVHFSMCSEKSCNNPHTFQYAFLFNTFPQKRKAAPFAKVWYNRKNGFGYLYSFFIPPSMFPTSPIVLRTTHIHLRLLSFSVVTLGLLLLGACKPDDSLPETILLPTLDLQPIEQSTIDLSAKVIGERDGIPLNSFTAQEAAAGFQVPADEHVLFRCPAGSSIDVNVAVGNPLLWNQVRYWGYEYSGNETENATVGKTGRDLFNGRFWLSQGERTISNACYGYLHSKDVDTSEINLNGSSLYYLVISGNEDVNGNGVLDLSEDLNNNCQLDPGEDVNNNGALDLAEDANENGVLDIGFPRNMRFSVSCLDADGDLLHTGNETAFGTNPQNVDTDLDGIDDGTEVMGQNPTNPINADTDGGDQPDGAEDLNRNGALDIGETDPTDPTDDVIGSSVCSDGLVTGAEECDPGVSNSEIPSVACVNATEVCNTITCFCDATANVVCGDGLIRGKETCDDGGTEDGNGCSAECQVEPLFACTDEPSVCEIPLPTLPRGSSAATVSSTPISSVWSSLPTFSSLASSVAATVCGDGKCTGGESAMGCDPSVEFPDLCANHILCMEDCSPSETVSVCNNRIPEEGESCDDGNNNPNDDCSADCQCDHWSPAATFMQTYCASATTDNEKLFCYLNILQNQWSMDVFTIPYPDMNCDGISEFNDVDQHLTPLVLEHFQE